MAKGNGIRGIRGHNVPTHRVIRSASYVQVRGKPRHPQRKTTATPIRVTYTRDAIERALAIMTVPSERSA
jgi:hypothetical protein